MNCFQPKFKFVHMSASSWPAPSTSILDVSTHAVNQIAPIIKPQYTRQCGAHASCGRTSYEDTIGFHCYEFVSPTNDVVWHACQQEHYSSYHLPMTLSGMHVRGSIEPARRAWHKDVTRRRTFIEQDMHNLVESD